MAGTFVEYQGLTAQRGVFRRSRGFGSDWSYVDIPVRAFKDPSFVLKLPEAGTGPDLPSVGGVNNNETEIGDGRVTVLVPEQLPTELDHSGTLTIADTDEAGKVFRCDATLYVARVETVRESFETQTEKQQDGSTKLSVDPLAHSMVRLTLVDARYFWPRGVLTKWSFNKQIRPTFNPIATADRSVVQNATMNDGHAWTRAEVAQFVVGCLWANPKLAKWPKSWETAYNADGTAFSIEWEPYTSAVKALRDLCAEAGVEEPILRLDNQVEIREAGDGKIAPCKNENGIPTGENIDAVEVATAALSDDGAAEVDRSLVREMVAKWNWAPMDGFRLFKDGAGQATVREPAYPDDVVIVVGKPIVASVAIDDWEAVLLVRADDTKFLPGTDPLNPTSVLPLTDETVRFLTSAPPKGSKLSDKNGNLEYQNSPYNLAWLKNWIIAPEEFQGQPDIPEAVLELFRKQAWRYYRLPNVETKDGLPGPNANLLPLQPRAEIVAGKRMPITVERFGFTTRHVEMTVSEVAKQVNDYNKILADLRYKIQRGTGRWDVFKIEKEGSWLATEPGDNKPIPGKSFQWLSTKVKIPASAFFRVAQIITGRTGLPELQEQTTDRQREELRKNSFANSGQIMPLFTTALDTARLFDRLRTELNTGAAGLVDEYEKVLRQLNDLEEKRADRPLNLALDLAKVCVDAEKEVDGTLARAARETDQRKIGQREAVVEQLLKASKSHEIAQKFVELDLAITAGNQVRQTRIALHKDGQIDLATYSNGRKTWVNLPRLIDGKARVESAEAGIIEVSELAGQLIGSQGPTPWDGRPFTPRPVRVTFGVTLAPSLVSTDLNATPSNKTATGGQTVEEQAINAASKRAIDDNKTAAREFDKEITALYDDYQKKLKDLALQNSPDFNEKEADLRADYQIKVKDINDRIFGRGIDLPAGSVVDQASQAKAGGQNIPLKFPLKSFEETIFTRVFRARGRDPKTGAVKANWLSPDQIRPQDLWNAVTVRRDYQMLVPLGAETSPDEPQLTRQAREVAAQMFRRQESHLGGRHVFGHPWSINCDGRVASVEIRTLEWEGVPCGHSTEVVEGSTAFAVRPQPSPTSTGERAGSTGK